MAESAPCHELTNPRALCICRVGAYSAVLGICGFRYFLVFKAGLCNNGHISRWKCCSTAKDAYVLSLWPRIWHQKCCSLPIHIPQCQKKWLAEEELKPKNQRRPLPEPPPVEAPIAGTSGGYNVDAFNDAAYAQWEGTLQQCPFCDRKFRPEAFKHHQKSCTASRPAKKAGTALTAASLSNRLQPGVISGTKRVPKQVIETKIMDSGSGLKVETTIGTGASKTRQRWSLTPSNGPGESSGTRDKCERCGIPYSPPEAKFCSECGAKRPTK